MFFTHDKVNTSDFIILILQFQQTATTRRKHTKRNFQNLPKTNIQKFSPCSAFTLTVPYSHSKIYRFMWTTWDKGVMTTIHFVQFPHFRSNFLKNGIKSKFPCSVERTDQRSTIKSAAIFFNKHTKVRSGSSPSNCSVYSDDELKLTAQEKQNGCIRELASPEIPKWNSTALFCTRKSYDQKRAYRLVDQNNDLQPVFYRTCSVSVSASKKISSYWPENQKKNSFLKIRPKALINRNYQQPRGAKKNYFDTVKLARASKCECHAITQRRM